MSGPFSQLTDEGRRRATTIVMIVCLVLAILAALALATKRRPRAESSGWIPAGATDLPRLVHV